MENESKIEFINQDGQKSSKGVSIFVNIYFALLIVSMLPLAPLSVLALFLLMPIFIIGIVVFRSKLKTISIVKRGLFFGSFIGFAIWFYDYGFLLNAGGPNAAICNQINGFLGVSMYGLFTISACVDFLVIPFSLIGLIIALIIQSNKNKSF